MAKRITEVTRRDLRDLLAGVAWSGRLEEVDFLSRLYDLDQMPSTDGRFSDAHGDIIQHRVFNHDWDDDWVLLDPRFDLANGSDETLLRFLAEMLHPVVRNNRQEAEELARQLNALLELDGYELTPEAEISGRPVYTASYVGRKRTVDSRTNEKPRHFTEDVRPLLATLERLAELDGSELEKRAVQEGNATVGEGEYDNWDGGTYYHTLTLEVPVDLFAQLGDQTSEIESRIHKRIEKVLRAPDNHHISAVVIQPALLSSTDASVSDVIVARAERPTPQFWAPDGFRLFITHVTSFKQRAAALRKDLHALHISGFVAHETIDPGELWQREIEAALRTMDALAALITPDFHASQWTDQEVGWALGLGKHVIPVRRGADPYGFMGEVQGIQGFGKTVSQVASEILSTLLRHDATRRRMTEALVAGFERSNSFAEARDNMTLLERIPQIPPPMLTRIEVAAATNDQIRPSTGVEQRVERLMRRFGG